MASIFDALLRERWEDGDDSASNVAIAERHLGVNEKQVRRWRKPEHSNDKPIPMAALLALPDSVAADLVERICAARGFRHSSARGALSAAINRLNPDDMLDAEKADALAELSLKLYGGRR